MSKSITLREKCPNTEFFLARIFPHSDWIRRDTKYFSVLSPNAGKYGPEKTPYYCTFHTVSLQILGLKLVKLDSIIIWLHFDTIKIVKNELDGACGLPLVGSVFCLICFPSLLTVFFFLSLVPLYKLGMAFVAGFWCSCLVKLCIFDVLSSKVIVFVGFFSDFIPS